MQTETVPFPWIKDKIHKSFAAFLLAFYFVFVSVREIGECYYTGEAVLVVVFQNGQFAVVDIMEVGSHHIAVFVQSSIQYIAGIAHQ